MFCINCGNKLENGANFCPNCGTKVENNGANLKETVTLKEKFMSSNETTNTKEMYLGKILGKTMLNKDVLFEMFDNGVFLSENDIKGVVDEFNKTHNILLKKRAGGIIHEYNRCLNEWEKNNKQMALKEQKAVDEMGITKEEFDSLTPFEKAQLKIMLDQKKDQEAIKKNLGWMNLAQGFRGL